MHLAALRIDCMFDFRCFWSVDLGSDDLIWDIGLLGTGLLG